jgi:demethylmenaquinone methyltransferase/2-methoxy-6-polyprenyl-1,4-benzoquinol methylase
VRTLFATIADRYDFITIALSYGQDRRWKRRLVRLAAPAVGIQALDLATGTGDIAFALAARGAQVAGLDLTPRMIELARAKGTGPRFLVGDMLALPFPAASFDVVTTGYGLRNVPNLMTAIEEIHRVLKPGGRLISTGRRTASSHGLPDSLPPSADARLGVAPRSRYGRHIPASIRQYPGAEAVVRMLGEHGFNRARYYPVLGGLMAIHHAVRN